ncbi:MAG TPA: DUF2975 domain-containing protein [Williamwhitmania sp.]|nr:DUF2975 domain-containing protein [Williamwhitmania sp.]
MSKGNNLVFKALHIVAWLIFVGLCIEAGGLIVNFVYSVFKPEIVAKLYQKLDLSGMYQQSKWAYYGMYSFAISISVLKAMLFYIVIELLYKLDLAKPFSSFAAKKIKQISYYTFSIGILSFIARETAKNLSHHGYEIDKLSQFWVDSQAFILMAAVIYIIATIFKKGVDIQNENDLTV